MKFTARGVCSMLACGLALAAVGLMTPAGQAETTTWEFFVETFGEDVFWVSDTATDTSGLRYDVGYELTEVRVRIALFLWPDVTGLIPPEYLSNSSPVAGPPPLTILDDDLIYPEPPDPTAIAAHMNAYVDAAGFGHMDVTNLVLGTFDFGEGQVSISGVRVSGTLHVTPRLPGDIDKDGDVDFDDLNALLAAYGTLEADAGYNIDADIDLDGDVDFDDLNGLLAHYGQTLP